MFSFHAIIQIYVYTFLLIFIVKIKAACKEENDKHFACSSVKDLGGTEVKNDWKSIYITSGSGKQEIEENAFKNVPNIKKLVFNGAAKKLNKNSFKGLDKLEVLQFYNNDLPELKGNIFANLPIKEFLCYTSNVHTLKPRCFDNLPNLYRVLIHKNPITVIPAGVFSYTNIGWLYLNENAIETIEEEAFYGMEKLKLLGLERNRLFTFDSHLLIGNTSPLEILWLAWQNFTRIDKNMLKPFPNLKVLLMQKNHIDTIENGAFDNNKNARYIDISNSKLEKLSHRIFPWEGLEKMDTLFLQNNRLIDLSTDFIEKLPRLRKIAIGGNPWLCPCYQKIRSFVIKKGITLLCDNNEYLGGQRPVCVSPTVGTLECKSDDENVQSLYDVFLEGQMDYPKLPPLCKVYCGNTSCYSYDFDVLLY